MKTIKIIIVIAILLTAAQLCLPALQELASMAADEARPLPKQTSTEGIKQPNGKR